VLASLAMLNMPQAMVLCIGGDGHVVVKPAGHDHRADGSHICCRATGGTHVGDHSHIGAKQGQSCIDIPIPVDAGDHRVASQRGKSAPVCVANLPALLQGSDAFDVPGLVVSLSSTLPFSRDASCRHIVLQV